MSTSKNIDKLCLIVIALTLVITLLFMNGKTLGVISTASNDGDGIFAHDDTEDHDFSGAAIIDLSSGTVQGNGAYFSGGDLHIVYAGSYILSGSMDGSLIIKADGDDKIFLRFDGIEINCAQRAAIDIENAKKVLITLPEGSKNTISSDIDSAKGIDGVIYSRDDLTISGNGSLNIECPNAHGIVCNDKLAITGGNIEITSGRDAIHVNDSAAFCDVNLTISAEDDGISVKNDDDSFIYVKSGSIDIVKCYEGLEAANITVDGGNINVMSTDDGFNSVSSTGAITINGGNIRVLNPDGRDADGFDSNGNIFINGGSVFISLNGSGINCALDYGSESGGICRIDGGVVIACGGSQMVEHIDGSSSQGVVELAQSGAAGAEVSLTKEGHTFISEIIPYSFSYVTLSCPELSQGDICVLSIDGMETEVTAGAVSESGFGGFGNDFEPPNMGDIPDFGNMPNMGDFPGIGDMPNTGDLPGIGDMPNTGNFPGVGDMPNIGNFPDKGGRPGMNGGKPDLNGGFDPGGMGKQPVDFGNKDFEQPRGEKMPMNPTSNSNPLDMGSFTLIIFSIIILSSGLIIAYKFRER